MPESKKFYGYFRAFPKGMNADVDPLLLPADQLAMATNATMRGTFVSQRPRFQKQSIQYDSSETQTAFQAGLFQGAAYYRTATAGYIMCAVAGRLFSFSIGANGSVLLSEIKDTTVIPNPNPLFPNPPAALVSVPANASVSLSWSLSDGASQYKLKRYTASGGPYAVISTQNGVTYTDTAVVNGTTYYYVVSAVNSAGESQNSTESFAKPQNVVPSAPLGLAATSGSSPVILSWSTVSNASTYNIKRSTIDGLSYQTLSSTASLSYSDSSAVNGTTYYYVVSASNSAGEGSNSTQISVRPILLPSVPLNLFANSGDNVVTLNWSSSANATSYRIKLYSSSTGLYETIATTSGTTYADTNVFNGNYYDYQISAVNASGESANTSSVIGQPQIVIVPPVSYPGTPGSLSANSGNATVALSWVAGAYAVTYNVKRTTTYTGTYVTIATLVSGLSYTDNTAVNGTTYYYVVSTVNPNGESANTSPVIANPVAPIVIPSTPSTPTATAGNAQVVLTWTSAANATSYVVVRLNLATNVYDRIAIVTSLTYTDTTVANGNPYTYRIIGKNSLYEGFASGSATATPMAPVVAPTSAPFVSAYSSANSRTAGLQWSGIVADTINIKRSTSLNGTYTTIATVPVTPAQYLDAAGLSNNTSYWYKLSAQNGSAEGPTTATGREIKPSSTNQVRAANNSYGGGFATVDGQYLHVVVPGVTYNVTLGANELNATYNFVTYTSNFTVVGVIGVPIIFKGGKLYVPANNDNTITATVTPV